MSARHWRLKKIFSRLPTWQVALIVIAVIIELVTFGALIQVLHGS